jgi:hypothetical protein
MSIANQSAHAASTLTDVTLEYSIYPLQKLPGAQMVPLLKGGSLIDCLGWYLAEAQQTGEVPIWCVAFIAVDAAPLAKTIMAAADAFSAAQIARD